MNNKKEKEFENYKNSLSVYEREKISEFFNCLKERTCCAERGWHKIKDAYQQAVVFYADVSMTVDEILKRLDISHLGGFYARRSGLWHPLDLVGNYKSIGYLNNEFGVYDMIYSTQDEIIPPLLQIAVYAAVKRYPLFSCRLKRGFFCYYLESSKKPVDVIKYTGANILTEALNEDFYKITYLNNKIILTYIDGITDSYGAASFFRAVTEYYSYLLSDDCNIELKANISVAPEYRENVNEFDRMEIYPAEWIKKKNRSIILEGNLCRNKGWKTEHFTMSLTELEELCKSKSESIKEYFILVVCSAMKESTDRLKGELSVGISCDLRNSYNSKTLRNFTYEKVIYVNKEKDNFNGNIKEQFNKININNSSCGELGNILLMNSSIKYVPLILKPYTKAYRQLSDYWNVTCSFGYYKFCDMTKGEDIYINLKPAGGVGCFVTVSGNRVVLTVNNNGTDPTFSEKIAELLRKDGIAIVEDREIIKSMVS